MSLLIALTLLLTPAYTIKFHLFGFSTDVLMVWIAAVAVVFAITLTARKQWGTFLNYVRAIDKRVLLFAALFLLAGILSLFVQGASVKKLGQFIVLFAEPITISLIAGFIIKGNDKARSLLLTACYLLLGFMGLVAIVQYTTLHFLPQIYWGNNVEPKRAVGLFSHPNFFALFTAPLLAFLISDAVENLKSKILPVRRSLGGVGNLKSILWVLGAAGLLLSLSRAGWIGLAAAIAVYVLVVGDKKIRRAAIAAVIIIFIITLSVPNLRYRVMLPFMGEKSTVSRFSLWHTGWKGIKESPVFGLGLTGFSQNWSRLNTDPNLDTHNFPHNIFLDFWVETGLLGLVSMAGLVSLLIYKGLKNKQNAILLGISLFLITVLFQGQFDNPYFKNDLALVFWLVVSLAV